MSYHCRLCEVTCTDNNDNWPEDVKLIFFLSFPLSFSPSFPILFSQFANAQISWSRSDALIVTTRIQLNVREKESEGDSSNVFIMSVSVCVCVWLMFLSL